MKNYSYLKNYSHLNSIKVIIFFLLNFIITLPLMAQEPYVPFPKDSLSWHVWGESINYAQAPASFHINGEEITIEGKSYTRVLGYGDLITGIREEDKKVYAYIPGFGEHILYDFNLDVGDTMYYNVGIYANWEWNKFGVCDFYEHYAIVSEKGTITLEDGSIRNTMLLQPYQNHIFDKLRWVEGIGNIEVSGFYCHGGGMLGLIDPFVVTQAINGTDIKLLCICKTDSTEGCLLAFSNLIDPIIFSVGCPCIPDVGIIENGKKDIVLYPNPTTGELIIKSQEFDIKTIEIFDIIGKRYKYKKNNFSTENKINISYLPTGIYFVKISTDSGEIIQKIMKE